MSELVDDCEAGLGLKGAKLLVKILLTNYNKNVEKFEQFAKEKIEILDEKNNDNFFQHLGDNFYAKNYIGFRSIKDIDKFMRFDFNIYKKNISYFQWIYLRTNWFNIYCYYFSVNVCILFKINKR